MDHELRKMLLFRQLDLAKAAAKVLVESQGRVGTALRAAADKASLSVERQESCEALTSRFARPCDVLVQRLFRTLDQVEFADEGTVLEPS